MATADSSTSESEEEEEVEEPVLIEPAAEPPPATEQLHPRQSAAFADSLMSQLSASLTPLLDAVDKLGDVVHDGDCRFPTIVAIGDQLSGKSSVLHSMSGLRFPQGDAAGVTRRPIQLRALRDARWTCRVSYQAGDDEVQNSLHEIDGVEQLLVDLQKATPTDKKVTLEDVIDIEIRSPDLPNLTLLDLPAVNENSRELVEHFVRDSHVIILVAFQANTDPATVSSFDLARQFDPNGRRTIGVMTHCDSLAAGKEQQVEKLLNGSPPPNMAVKNFVAVSCRSQDEEGNEWPREEAMEQEAEFFRTAAPFKKLPRSKVSSRALRQQIVKAAFQLLVPMREQVLEEIRERRIQKQQEIARLQSGACRTLEDSVQVSNRLLFDLIRNIGEHLTGSNWQKNPFYAKCMTRWTEYREDILKRKANLLKNLKREIQAEYQNQRGRELPFLTSIFPVLERVVYERFVLKCRPAVECMVNDVTGMVREHLSELTDRHLNEYPKLQTHVYNRIDEIFRACKRQAREKVLEELESESQLFSLTPEFFELCRTSRSAEQQKEFDQLRQTFAAMPQAEIENAYIEATGGANAEAAPDVKGVIDSLTKSLNVASNIAEGFLEICTYLHARKEASRSVEDAFHQWEEVDRLCKIGAPYITVACNRLIDNLPRQLLKHAHHRIGDQCKTIIGLLAQQEKVHELMQDSTKELRVDKAKDEKKKWKELERRILEVEELRP